MRHAPIDPSLFCENRRRLIRLLPPGSLAIIQANDTPPTNADGTLRSIPNSDLFHLTGVEQEESILVLFPDAEDERHREVLFLRETNERIAVWEGHKLTQDSARDTTGVRNVQWLSEFPSLLHRWMCAADHVWLPANEHPRAEIVVESRTARFTRHLRERYPLHHYHRLARLLHRLRAVKQPAEIQLTRQACTITRAGFERVARLVRPGVAEHEIEAEFAHEFIRNRAGFAYPPIIASGRNSCVLHYNDNDQTCRAGDLLLLDVAANYANYNADLTRTLPVNGRFSRRQRAVYEAVLDAMNYGISLLRPGLRLRDWQRDVEDHIAQACVHLGLLRPADLHAHPEDPAQRPVKRYFMHGLGHPLGLDVHDVSPLGDPVAAGWIMTVEPGIYLPDEGFGVRLENNILVTDHGPVDLMADIPVDPDAIEALMRS
jgi:Xaa-Pro aminopeptidase